MEAMEENEQLPDTNQLSVLTATIMLAYAVTPFIQAPERNLSLQLPGIFLSINLSFATITLLLAAALAGVGADWLAHSHPHFEEHRRDSRYWIEPALAAWVIGVPLSTLKVGLEWWAVFGLGGVLLVVVYVAEYIAIDPADNRHALASVALTAVAFALFLTLAIAIKAAGPRLYVILPALVVMIFLVVLRTLFLRLGGRWIWNWSIGIALVTAQLVIGLHYWPLSPLQFGLVLTGAVYAMTSLAGALEEGRNIRALWVEPILMMLVMWMIAFLMRR
jgi:hypothetical protein